MNRKKYVEKDITSFFKSYREISKSSKKPIRVDENIISKIKDFLRERGEVTKTELYKWSKKNQILPSYLYYSISQLIESNIIKKYFDSRHEDIVYKYVSK